MDVAVAVGLAGGRVVHMRQPVVGGYLACHVQDQPAEAVSLVGVGVDTPVALVEIFFHGAFDVDQRMLQRAQLRVALTVHDVGTGRLPVPRLDQHFFDDVLDGFYARARVAGQPCRHARAQDVGFGRLDFAGGTTGRGDGADDVCAVEWHDAAV